PLSAPPLSPRWGSIARPLLLWSRRTAERKGVMERITITVDEDLLREIDALSEKRGYASRSEIFRDMAREALAREAIGPDGELDNDRPCYGALTYVYDHGIR